MQPMMKTVDLSTIAEGAAPELFSHELRRVLDNIADPNVAPAQKRSITLKFDFKPTKDRGSADVELTVKTHLPPTNGHAGSMFLHKVNGKVEAFQRDPKQADMFDENVKLMAAKAEGVSQ